MKILNKHIYIFLFAFCLLLVGVCCAACNKGPDGVAAQVNSTNIYENDLTAYISGIRRATHLENDQSWHDSMKKNNTDGKKVREENLYKFIDAEVYIQLADKFGIKATKEEIENYINGEKSNYKTEEEFQNYVKTNFGSWELYEHLKTSEVDQNKVEQYFINSGEVPSDIASKYFLSISQKLNGARGYYLLQFSASEASKAQDYLNRINAGQLSFEDAAKQRENEDPEHLSFSHVTYDFMTNNPQELTDVIKSLAINQVSGLIKTGNYIYIVKLVDIAKCPNDIYSIDQLAENTKKYVTECARINSSGDIVQKRFSEEKSKFDIKKYDPPANLPYF